MVEPAFSNLDTKTVFRDLYTVMNNEDDNNRIKKALPDYFFDDDDSIWDENFLSIPTPTVICRVPLTIPKLKR